MNNCGRHIRTRSAGALLDECKYDVQFNLFSAPLDEGSCHEVTEG